MRALLLATALLLAPPLTRAASGFDITSLMRTLAAVETVDATFEEHKTLAALDRPLRLSGTLRYRAPDYFSKQTLRPYRELFEADGARVVSETLAHGRRTLRLDERPQIAALVASLRGTLAGDLDALRGHYAFALSGDRDAWTLTLTPTDDAVRRVLAMITVSGSGGRVDRVEIVETGGDRSLLTIRHG